MKRTHSCAALLAATLGCVVTASAQTLTGWAQLPAATFADGPTSGQFAAPNPYGTNVPPYVARQPVQGLSGVLHGPRPNTYMFLVDNGFGARGNSADALLRTYTMRIDWRTAKDGSGTVSPVDMENGRKRKSFDATTRMSLNDSQRRLTLPIQADYEHYYNIASNPLVAPEIRSGRLLTGADFDIESFRRDAQGNYWFGDEFGPYLIKTDANGTVLRSQIALPGVRSPQNHEVLTGTASANLPSSGGFEGMALSADGTKLLTLLERTVAGDPARTLRINEFDLATETYTGIVYHYPVDAAGTAIGDMVAVDDHRYIVIERNGGTSTNNTPPFKKLYLIDIEGLGSGATVAKTELVDLMNIADPDDLNQDGSTVFTLPYVTIENVLVLGRRTLLVANDNNFPYGGGRALASDNTEFLRIALPKPLTCKRCDD